jgi:hypothetical protein
MMKLLTIMLLSLGVLSAPGGPYAVDWHTMSGGGGTSTGGVYSVCGTIGQLDTGFMAGGDYSIDAGLWEIIATLQTPGPPVLSIQLSATEVTISWPSSSVGFVLQQNTHLPNVAGWSPVSSAIHDHGSTKSVTVPISSGTWFYRLVNL